MKKTLKLILPILAVALLMGGCTISGTISIGGKGMLYGYVTDPFDEPVQGAHVEVEGHGFDTTDQFGYYEITNVPVGWHKVRATKFPWSKTKKVYVVSGKQQENIQLD